MSKSAWHDVCAIDEVVEGALLSKPARGRFILLIKIGSDIYAYADRCPHIGAPLSDGRLINNRITCRHHHWQFNVQTGKSVRPSGSKLMAYPLRIEDGRVMVEF